MSERLTIALDAMGGDNGTDVVTAAALQFLSKSNQMALILVGKEDMIIPHLGGVDFGDRLTVRHASQAVSMDELPSSALRNKKDSSMRVALNLVKKGAADACVSAGNTGP